VRTINARRALACLLATLLAPAAPAQPLQAELDRLVITSQLDPKLKLSVRIIELDSGAELASHKDDAPMIPASNMKLLTSGTALAVLGPDFAFETTVGLAPGEGGARVVVHGGGDPALADPDLLLDMGLGVEELLEVWVDAIVAAAGDGVAEVVVDDRVFDREFTHPTWPRSQLNRRYCAQVAGLNFHGNVVSVFTRPGQVGRPPTLTLEPESPWLDVSNRAKTVGKGKQHTAWASRSYRTNDISVHGDVRYGTMPIEVTLHDVPGQVAEMVADRLERRQGRRPAARVVGAEERLDRGRTVHTVRTRLATVLERCNKDSENLYAEAMLKRVGHEVSAAPGSWSSGAAVVRMELNERLGSNAGAQIIVADGSGMSRENRVTTDLLAAWMRSLLLDERVGEAFLLSLPVAGEEGTLRKRFGDEDLDRVVRAKTGYLSGVSAMTGVVPGPGGRGGAVFAIISNEKPNNVPLARVRELEEDIVDMVDDWVDARAPKMGG
jgi:D-alanyl-D-alanine carboxypeptidase/D-alanyl-D-alanine-endopeptidase (penicillin-binding protein 4)